MSQEERFRDFSNEKSTDEFAQVQQAMVRNWVAALQARGVDLDSHYKQRHQVYDARWRSALNPLSAPARILDIGGGHLHDSLLELLTAGGHTYHEHDIDPEVVANNRKHGARFGLPEGRFTQGENTSLPFEDESFDLVFSSHCLEHSRDLRKTLSEVHRVLKPGGRFYFAVPIGWDFSIEHIYFLDVDDWVALARESGFKVRGVQVSDFYPETGHDLVVEAVREGEVRPRLDLDRFRKSSFRILPYTHPSISLRGEWHRKDTHAIGLGPDSLFLWQGTARAAHLLVGGHDWSGTTEVLTSEGGRHVLELYSWYPKVKVVPLTPSPALPPGALERELGAPRWEGDDSLPEGVADFLGRNTRLDNSRWALARPIQAPATSHSCQLVVYGVLLDD